jgi:hypothetical protein
MVGSEEKIAGGRTPRGEKNKVAEPAKREKRKHAGIKRGRQGAVQKEIREEMAGGGPMNGGEGGGGELERCVQVEKSLRKFGM